MTYKEKLKELSNNNPVLFDKSFINGVLGCPEFYFDVEAFNLCESEFYRKPGTPPNEDCFDCWNRQYRNERLKVDLERYIEEREVLINDL